MAFRLSTNTQNRACNTVVTTPDTGGTTYSSGQILIYTGSQPTTPQATATGTLLATVPLNNPSFSAASSGVSNLITSPGVTTTVSTSGTAGWFRLVDRGGNAVFDGAVSTSGAELNLNTVSLVSGGTLTINSLTVTVPM